MKKIAKHTVEYFLLAFLLSTCSLINTTETSSVTFTIDRNTSLKISEAAGHLCKSQSDSKSHSNSLDSEKKDNLYFDIELKGGYSAVKTIPVLEETTATFDNIPVGTSLYAEANAYFIDINNEKNILFLGKSEEITIKEGKNVLSLSLKSVNSETEPVDPKNKPDSDNDDEPESVGEPETVEEPEISIQIFVSQSGDDETGVGNEEYPFASITKACKIMTEESDYTINVDGTLTGTQQIIENTGNATKIFIKGTNDLDSNGEPQDVLDMNKAGSVNSVSNGTVLIINTTTPVTINNLKITGGYGGGSTAGGINIAQGATVKLGDGVLVTGNRNPSNGRGGAIHNEGTLFMYGTAVIGDKTATTTATSSSSYTDFNNGKMANYATSGGAIFNGSYNNSSVEAKLYIGYSGFEKDGVTPVKKELSGGFYYNSSSGGGAVYNASGSKMYFASGTMEWNTVDGSTGGGAIYNESTLEMSGGKIINNYSKQTNADSGHGGGVVNAKTASIFIMSGGIINKNKVSGDGGGVWNGGKMYMFGTAVIGDSSATTAATDTSYGNYAVKGGGIYNDNNSASGYSGKLFLGYSDEETKEDFTGGVYYNYSSYEKTSSPNYGGGGISVLSSLKMSGGTIAFNTAKSKGGGIFKSGTSDSIEIYGGEIYSNEGAAGGAIYMATSSTNVLTLGGSFDIPKDDGKNDIYLAGTGTSFSRIKIASDLDGSLKAIITPESYTEGNQLVNLTSDSTANLEAEVSCFKITPQTDASTGNTVAWYLTNEGKLTTTNPDP